METEELAQRVFESVLGAQEVQAAHLGHLLGWYEALADAGPMTSAELASATGTAERYAREWLEHQAVCGYLVVEDPALAPGERRFSMPEAHAAVLADRDSLAYTLPLARFVASVGTHLDEVAQAYRSGSGVTWAVLGDGAREAQADANRPMFLHQLGQELLPAVPDLDARLSAGARVADVGCGEGWSSIGIALAYPESSVDGFDLDGPSIASARTHAEHAGVADRVTFRDQDAALVGGRYDVVFAFECIHDLSDPVGVLTAMRSLAADEGEVIVMDERVADEFTAPGDQVERLMYGYSLTCCLPDGLSHPPATGTGTVMRRSTLEGYASEAGFDGVEVLPIDHDFFRFYRLEG